MEVMETPLMSVRHLYKQFGTGCIHCKDGRTDALVGNYCPHCGTVYACRDLNFDLYDGEILGVVGESGSGKSTMMRCLYFDQEVSSGSATIRTYKDGRTNLFTES
ncbi:ATP-binding cassette domain-containing protein, partial [Holdemania massiliensis]